MRLGQELGLGLAKAHRAARAGLHLAHEEDPHAQDQEHGQPACENAPNGGGTIRLRARRDRHAFVFKAGDQRRIARRVGLEPCGVIDVRAGDALARDIDGSHAARFHALQKFRIRNGGGSAALLRRLKQVEQRDQKHGDDRPEREISIVRIHLRFRGGAPLPKQGEEVGSAVSRLT